MTDSAPFLVWPIGWHDFLLPLFNGNPIRSVMRVGDLADEAQVSKLIYDLVGIAKTTSSTSSTGTAR